MAKANILDVAQAAADLAPTAGTGNRQLPNSNWLVKVGRPPSRQPGKGPRDATATNAQLWAGCVAIAEAGGTVADVVAWCTQHKNPGYAGYAFDATRVTKQGTTYAWLLAEAPKGEPTRKAAPPRPARQGRGSARQAAKGRKVAEAVAEAPEAPTEAAAS